MKDGDFLRTSCGSPNYAAPEVISGNLYAGPEVDVWSCGVILYALLCGSLPFDDESIPNLFKKIKSGMYSLPSHLSQLARDLIPRMLVVDPMKRITIPEIRQHPWYQHKLPAYLRLPPELMEKQERVIDEECIREVLKSPFRGVTGQRVLDAIQRRNQRHDLKVAYEIILDHKQAKQRTAEVMMLMQQSQHDATPPAFSPHQGRTPGSGAMTPTALSQNAAAQPRLAEEASRALARHNPAAAAAAASGSSSNNSNSGGVTPQPLPGLSSAPSSSSQQQQAAAATAAASAASAAAAAAATAAASTKKRRWYLGIQSKKDPAHVMTEVYKALLQLRCEWSAVSSYRLKCRWRPNAVLMMQPHPSVHDPQFLGTLSRQASMGAGSRGSGKWPAGGVGGGTGATAHGGRGHSSQGGGGEGEGEAAMEEDHDFWPVDPSAEDAAMLNPLLRHDYTVIIGLNLYKVGGEEREGDRERGRGTPGRDGESISVEVCIHKATHNLPSLAPSLEGASTDLLHEPLRHNHSLLTRLPPSLHPSIPPSLPHRCSKTYTSSISSAWRVTASPS